MATKKLTMQEQAERVLEKAEEKGVSTNFFFKTTFERYLVQMKIMDDLKKNMAKDGTMVEKEYVKGRKNIYTNPAITEYNKTATAANNTVATLIKIVAAFNDDDDDDELVKFLKGRE